MKTIGIQGGAASYTEAAALKLHPKAQITYYETFTDVFSALRSGTVTSVVVAIANNRVQFIPDSYEQLTTHDSGLSIVGEAYLRIEHALLALPGSSIDNITEVHSQAPAIGQCSHFLEKVLPDAHVMEEHDTAGSAKIVAESGSQTKAAIASMRAGELYGLHALQTSIQDDTDNITRFVEVQLAKNSQPVAQADKTSILLVTTQSAGSLAKALQVFAEADINLLYLQSRIIPNSPFHIDFFVEFEAGLHEERAQRALRAVKELGYDSVILGSYKAAQPMDV